LIHIVVNVSVFVVVCAWSCRGIIRSRSPPDRSLHQPEIVLRPSPISLHIPHPSRFAHPIASPHRIYHNNNPTLVVADMSHQRHYSEGTAYDLSVPLASPSHHSAGPSRTPVTTPAQPHPQSQSHSYPHPHSSHRDPLSHPHPHSQQQSHQSHQSHPYAQPAMAASQALRKSPTSSAQDSRGQTASPALDQSAGPVIRRVGGKANVSSACGPCKRAHLACDVGRPCKRCINMGKEDQCEDVPVSDSDKIHARNSIHLNRLRSRTKSRIGHDRRAKSMLYRACSSARP
jgi:hypothetical protein